MPCAGVNILKQTYTQHRRRLARPYLAHAHKLMLFTWHTHIAPPSASSPKPALRAYTKPALRAYTSCRTVQCTRGLTQ